MSIEKSTRHQKIIGDAGEAMICNWLSRSGFEVSIIDHTGIDIVAYNKKTKERLGITVKSRTRDKGNDHAAVTIFGKGDEQKVKDACTSFECKPWLGIYVETETGGFIFLGELEYYQKHYATNKTAHTLQWLVSKKILERYKEDPNIKFIEIQYTRHNWNWDKQN